MSNAEQELRDKLFDIGINTTLGQEDVINDILQLVPESEIATADKWVLANMYFEKWKRRPKKRFI